MGCDARSALCLLWACGIASAAVPRGWRWTARCPFRELAATASSEQADRWPASKAIDGDTSEPTGLWQTQRNSPKSAWLELQLARPRRVKGVRIFHQQNPRYYRSIDYAIACWTNGAWETVAHVKGNKQAGWREHPFDAMETTKVRITIAKSEYGYRMGLNEVELDFVPRPAVVEADRVSAPHRCGVVPDMGIIIYDAETPPGSRISIATRTAHDADGKPGQWSPWSPPYPASGARVVSPKREWIQFRAAHHGSERGVPVLRQVTIGSPDCIECLDLGRVLSEPAKPFALGIHFRRPMDPAQCPVAMVTLPGRAPSIVLGDGLWGEHGRRVLLRPVLLWPDEGVASVTIGGARTRDGVTMMHEERAMIIGTKPVLDRLVKIGEWMMAHEQSAIFVEGYNERTLLGLYEITGEKRYLGHVRKYVHKLLGLQDPAGFWGTGYKTVYFADTGSALGLFINFYKFATPEERTRIDRALGRYFELLLVKGDSTGKPFVHPDGSLGVGFSKYVDGKAHGDLNQPYTISTALTGAEIFAAWYYMKGDARYKQMAVKACDWILETIVGAEPPDPWAAPGQIPYYIDDWNPGRKNREWVWKRWPYDTSAYAGEGFIAAWTYIGDGAFRKRLGQRVRPHIEWLLRTQNDDGSWAAKGSGDQLRSHGVVNLLLWYHEQIEPDPRIADALRRYVVLLVDERRSAYLRVPGNGIATSLAGRALVEIVRPGVDCYRWKDKPR